MPYCSEKIPIAGTKHDVRRKLSTEYWTNAKRKHRKKKQKLYENGKIKSKISDIG